ncbi:hypothetical protein CP985_05640 [Malaciobacter mytili LMG 24559]|uniref:Uncharacterized protein n=1 Tax=Malaciobacter mytili LMG 24559 TaxID=1032238 RepID=A0AAX2AIP5_9BACT|nr:hypothetical protein [Malaciobacter mytili]AXH14368.1 hypothetical protein AMYT_0775 [Malaciobacter mytili LMG 24559]RXK16056.1 hypothetical protein CP985_05640 [Malaciobacter mytili LMG 24559]
MHLNETEAKTAIETLIKEHAGTDFEVVILRRKPKDLISKYVFFGLKVASKNSEVFFNDLMIATASTDSLEVIESEIVEENKKIKDIFLIRAEVEVVKIEEQDKKVL